MPAQHSARAAAGDPLRLGVIAAERRFGARLRDAFYASPIHQWRLGGRAPDRILTEPPDSLPGSAAHGNTVLAPGVSFSGRRPPTGGEGGAHGFDWLRDLHAVGSDAARARGRELVLDWIGEYGRWDPLAWRPDILARRVVNWITQLDFFGAGADADFTGPLFASLGRQVRHLARTARRAPPGAPRIAAAKGLIFTGALLPEGRRRLRAGCRLLETEIARQVLADGGHFQRSPALQLTVLRDLVDARAALLAVHHEVAPALQGAIDRMAPMLRFFRHGDGGLALFNGSGEGDRFAIDLTLNEADATGRPPGSAPHVGYQRMSADGTVVIMDSGAAPQSGLDGAAHAGTLSFEMSVGADRVVINCGAMPDGDAAWSASQRTTAAHSTLTVDDTNSAEVLPGGGLGRRPVETSCKRDEDGGATWVNAAHDGYAGRFGLVHHRRLYLGAGGGDLRGEDRLTGLREGRPFTVRFHLHPDVRVYELPAPERDAAPAEPAEPDAAAPGAGPTVELRLPGGAVWRLQAAGGELSIAPSVYLGAGVVAETQQIVISGRTAEGGGYTVAGDGDAAVVKWALQRTT